MRIQQLFECLTNYNFSTAESLAKKQIVNGGWEVWLQVELCKLLKTQLKDRGVNFIREVQYPAANRISDFYISYGNEAHLDPTYCELKCINPFDDNPEKSAVRRFCDDITKVHELKEADIGLNCICLLYFAGAIDTFQKEMGTYLPQVPMNALPYFSISTNSAIIAYSI